VTEQDYSFDVEDTKDESDVRFPDSRVVKGWNLPLYVSRKIIYLSIRLNLFVVDKVSEAFNFEFSYGLEEQGHWAWLQGFRLPRPWLKAGVKKED